MDSLTTLNTYSATSVLYTDEVAGSATLTNRYQINGVIDTNQSVIENLERVCSAAGSWLSYDVAAGQWGVVINRSGSSVSSFSNSNIIGSISVSGSGLKDLYNAVRVEFPNRDVRDASDFVKIELPAGEKNSNELPNTLNLAYDIINEPVQAQLLGFIELKQSRVDLLITFETDYSKISLKAGDLIDVTGTTFGFSAKVFRIISIAEKQGDGPITLEITALEYDAGVYTTADLTRFVRSDSTGIITIGSIGTPGTPTITKFEVDSRPRIVITSTAPTGIVEAMEFWRTTDTSLSESARSYNLIGTQRPVGGGTYSSGTTVTLEFDTLNASNFLIKTRGINEFTVGNFSGVSGLIEYVPQQITDGIDENTKIYDALTQAATGFAINFALKKLDELLGGTAGSLWERIADILRDYGIPVPQTPPAPGDPPAVSEPIDVAYNNQIVASTVNYINFEGAGVQVDANTASSVTITIAGSDGGDDGGGSTPPAGSSGSIDTTVRKPQRGDTIAYTGDPNGKWVPVPSCCDQLSVLNTYPEFPAYVDNVVVDTLTIASKLPPDRETFIDSTLNKSATTDKAPITGSYYLSFSGVTYGGLVLGSGVARIYASNGTELGSGVSASSCTVYKNILKIPFPTRQLKTDYYVTMPEGFVRYCNLLSEEIKAPRLIPAVLKYEGGDTNTWYESDDKEVTVWNFNTPVRASLAPEYTRPVGTNPSPVPQPVVFPQCSGFKIIKKFYYEIDRPNKDYPSALDGTTQVVIDDIKSYIGQNFTNGYVNQNGKWKKTIRKNSDTELTFKVKDSTDDPRCAKVLVLTFDQKVRVGTGNILIIRSIDNVVKKTIDASTGVLALGLTGSSTANRTIIYESLSDLDPSFEYYINADRGIAQSDTMGDCYVSAYVPTIEVLGRTLKFTLGPAFNIDTFTVRDVFDSLGTGNGRTDVHSEIKLIFNRTLLNEDGIDDLSGFGSSGTITIYKSDGSVHQTFNLADRLTNSFTNELLKIDNKTLIINPTTDLDFDTTYYVLYSAGVVVSDCYEGCPALSDTSRVRFKTEAGPASPAIKLNSTNSVNETGLNLPFDRKVEAGSGLLKVIDVATGTEVASVPATDSAVTFNNYTDGA